jgi:hypothetical protein
MLLASDPRDDLERGAYFSASSGVSSIPIDRAASAGVTVLATYQPTS